MYGADRALGVMAQRLLRGFGRLQDEAGMSQQFLAFGGEQYTAGTAVEERDAEIGLEGLDADAERRLCDMQLFGSGKDRAAFGDGNEIAQIAKVHENSGLSGLPLLDGSVTLEEKPGAVNHRLVYHGPLPGDRTPALGLRRSVSGRSARWRQQPPRDAGRRRH